MVDLNDGILDIYEKEQGRSSGGKSAKGMKHVKKAWFGYLGMGTKEHYESLQSSVKVEKRVRVLQDNSLSANHIIVIDGKQYQVGRTFDGTSDDGMSVPITDITLERTEVAYDIK